MSEEKKEVVAPKIETAPKPKFETAPVKKHMSDEEVWLRIYCAAISANINMSSAAKGVATAGLAEFKAQFK